MLALRQTLFLQQLRKRLRHVGNRQRAWWCVAWGSYRVPRAARRERL